MNTYRKEVDTMKFYYVVVTETDGIRRAEVLTVLDTDNLINKIPPNTVELYQHKTFKSAKEGMYAWNEVFEK